MSTDLKPRKFKQKEPKSQPVNGAERLKTVVRRLPPNLPEDVFWQSVQAWVTDETITWKSYHPGKLRTKRASRGGIPSRAYIAFKNEALVATFSRAYDGHVFRDKAGNESHAVVEYAPFQKMPTEKKKTDARNNTIDKDDDYLSFLETLKSSAKTESVSLDALIAAAQPPPPPTTTPLLEALKAEKSAQKDREAILRNHAHYKDAGVSGLTSKKEESKKKATAAVAAVQQAKLEARAQAQTPGTPPAPTGKKAKKAAAAAQQKAGVVDGQGISGKSGPVGATSAPTSAKPLPALARHRPPREPHGRSHPGKGDAPGPGLAQPPAVTIEGPAPAGGPVPVQGQRKNRPVIGLGRQFEAALSGAGVAVSQGPGVGGGPATGPSSSDRKRREKGGETSASANASAGTGTGTGATLPGTAKGKQKHREVERSDPPVKVVPSILQRPVGGTSAGRGAEVMIMQRPQSTEGGPSASVGAVAANPGSGFGPGGPGGRGARRRRGRDIVEGKSENTSRPGVLSRSTAH